jgi:hypothetical protein
VIVIGKVLFTSDGKPAEATLDDAGAWSCPARPDVADTLAALAAVRPYRGPGDGRFGVRWLHDAANMLGGRAEVVEVEATPGQVY